MDMYHKWVQYWNKYAPWFRIIASWIQSLMVYKIKNAKLTFRAFGQTQFITCIFWKSHWKKMNRATNEYNTEINTQSCEFIP
jgi:hypothetical protein